MAEGAGDGHAARLLDELAASASAEAVRFADDVDRLCRLAWSAAPGDVLELDVAGTLRIGQQAAALRLSQAERLTQVLPLTLAALRDGRVWVSQARIVVEETRNCSEPVAAEVERRVLAGLGDGELAGWFGSRLTRRVKRAVLSVEAALEPEHTAERERVAREGRRVSVRPEPDGMAGLWALLPVEQLRVFTVGLDELTRRQRVADRDAGVVRTADQRRADVLALLPALALHALDGTVPPTGGGHGSLVVNVHVPVATALGLSDEPGELQGYGPVSAGCVRRMLPDATLRRVLVDSRSGEVVHVDSRTTRPASGIGGSGGAGLGGFRVGLRVGRRDRPGPAGTAGVTAERAATGGAAAGGAAAGGAAPDRAAPDRAAPNRAAAASATTGGATAARATAGGATADRASVDAEVIEQGQATRGETSWASGRPVPGPTGGSAEAAGATSSRVAELLRRRLLAMLVDEPVLVEERVEPQYRPSEPLARLVKARDGHCVGIGCSLHADAVTIDLDHRDPWPVGQTRAGNLAPLSRRCHRAKTLSWGLHRHPDGSHTWTSPTGRQYWVPGSWSPPPTARAARSAPPATGRAAEVRRGDAAGTGSEAAGGSADEAGRLARGYVDDRLTDQLDEAAPESRAPDTVARPAPVALHMPPPF